MLDALLAWFTLCWKPEPKIHPLPSNILRHFVETPDGDLELLISEPTSAGRTSSSKPNPPIFFIHGGFGHAAVWLEWMSHLSTTYNARTYSFSVRNHGASYSVPYWKMVWQVSFEEVADDLKACVKHVRSLENSDPVLVAHSSGGGISQYLLSKSMIQASGLALVGAIPHYGNLIAYSNWFSRADHWFGLRGPFHLYHPRSPLSTDKLVYNAFFGPEFPMEKVQEFSKWMPNYESMWWPLQMFGRGGMTLDPAKRSWLEPVDILRNITGWSSKPGLDSKVERPLQDKIMVMMGTHDNLMLTSEERMVREYQQGIATIFPAAIEKVTGSKAEVVDKYVTETKGNGSGVRYVEVLGAGHHTQNDVQWKEAADALTRFAEQV